MIHVKPGQALLLWNLLITGEEPAMSKAKPELKPSERKILLEAGFIQLEKRGRSQHLVLTDKAWDWAVENFDVALSPSAAAAPILQTLLLRLGQHLQAHQLSLSSFLRTAPSNQFAVNTETVNETGSQINLPNAQLETQSSIPDIPARIRQAYQIVARDRQHHRSERVRLSQLRQHLTDLPQEAIDQVLCDMELAGELILMPLEDPTEITPEDERAVLDIAGYKCHIVYMKR